MKHISFFGALAALFLYGTAQAAQMPKPTYSILLYPSGQNVDQGIVENGVNVTLGPGESNALTGDVIINEFGEYYNTNDQARLDIYLPEKCNGQMLVDCPGGGYMFTSMTNEGVNVADWCIRNDIACCVVSYRLPNHHDSVPLTDVQNAFRYCRAHAAEWGVKQIGVIGFSAGGHLAGSANTMYVDAVTRPDFAVLVYPVITFNPEITHEGTKVLLLKENPDPEQIEYWSVDRRVSDDTPQTIIFLSDDDTCVPSENALLYYRQMKKHGRSCELHIFRDGNHGWGFTTVQNSGRDGLGRQRSEFFKTLSRWLADRRTEIQ